MPVLKVHNNLKYTCFQAIVNLIKHAISVKLVLMSLCMSYRAIFQPTCSDIILLQMSSVRSPAPALIVS